jgi:hypothetical protein
VGFILHWAFCIPLVIVPAHSCRLLLDDRRRRRCRDARSAPPNIPLPSIFFLLRKRARQRKFLNLYENKTMLSAITKPFSTDRNRTGKQQRKEIKASAALKIKTARRPWVYDSTAPRRKSGGSVRTNSVSCRILLMSWKKNKRPERNISLAKDEHGCRKNDRHRQHWDP